MAKWLMTADWHARRKDQVWVRHDRLRGDTAFGIQQVYDIAIKNAVSGVFLLGDIAESAAQHSDTIHLLREFLDKCEQNRIDVFYVQGQHEFAHPPLLSAMHPWPIHVHNRTVDLGSCIAYGLDYQTPANVQDALRLMPAETTCLLTHQVWKEYMGENRGYAALEWLPDRVTHVFTGDLHQHRQDTFGTRQMVSPGPLCAQEIRETEGKGVWLLEEDGQIRDIPLRTRQFYRLRIENDYELQKFLQHWDVCPWRIPQAVVPPEIASNVVQVQYSTDIKDVAKQLESVLQPEVHLFLEPFEKRVIDGNPDEEALREKILSGGMESALEHYKSDADVYKAALRLWQTNDLSNEIRTLVKELMS